MYNGIKDTEVHCLSRDCIVISTDYELQSALLEAIFRFSNTREREAWGKKWFGSLSEQFAKIREAEFEAVSD